MSKIRYCILGDSGLLGQALVQVLGMEASNTILGISRAPFQPTPFWKCLQAKYEHHVMGLLEESFRFRKILKEWKPKVVINTVALADVDHCEKKPELAEALNCRLPEFLADLTWKLGIDFIHISTDQIFDGTSHAPYSEEDVPNPIHCYGRTKWMGEQGVRNRHPKALVVRTNIVGFRDRPERKMTFSEWLCKSLAQLKEITLFDDYITNSIHVESLSGLLLNAYDKRVSGVINLVSRYSISKYGFGELLARELGFDFSLVQKGRLREAALVPMRPGYLALDPSKGELLLAQTFPTVHDTVKRIAKDFKVRRRGSEHITETLELRS